MQEKFIDFERCAKTLYTADRNIGKKEPWPPMTFPDIYLYSSSLAAELHSIFNEIKQPTIKLANKIRSPASIWKLISFSINGMRNNPQEWNKEKRELVISKMLSLISEKVEDIYYEKGTNTLRTGFDPKQLDENPLETTNRLNELKTSAWLYTESIYYMMHDLGAMLHGPYSFNNKHYLIHDFYNLKPIDIWPDAPYIDKINFNSMRIISEYPEVGISFDAFNNYSTSTNISKPDKSWAFIDEKSIDYDYCLNAISTFHALTIDAANTTLSLGSLDRARKKIEITWAILKSLNELRNRPWKPQNIDEMLDSKPIKKKYENIGFLKKFNVSMDVSPTGEQEFNKN